MTPPSPPTIFLLVSGWLVWGFGGLDHGIGAQRNLFEVWRNHGNGGTESSFIGEIFLIVRGFLFFIFFFRRKFLKDSLTVRRGSL